MLLLIVTGWMFVMFVLIIYLLRSWLFPAPFPCIPAETTKDTRSLKNVYHSRKIPENLDAIVIGSGIGGMAVAAILSKYNKRVLILEQHDQIGGCCHVWKEKGFEFDTGIHYIGEQVADTKTVLGTLCNEITDGRLRWEYLDTRYDSILFNDKRIDIPATKQAFKHELSQHFPQHEQDIQKYIDLCEASTSSSLGGIWPKLVPQWIVILLYKWLPPFIFHFLTLNFFKHSQHTLQTMLQRITNNTLLQTVLAYNFLDYGTIPSMTNSIVHTLCSDHFRNGAVYPHGGGAEIPLSMIPTIERTGGTALVQAKVSEIIVQGGQAIGVKLEKDGNTIFAPIVISDCGVVNTFQRLITPTCKLSKQVCSRYIDACGPPAVAGFMVFIGLEGSKEELQLQHEKRQFWIFDSSTEEYQHNPDQFENIDQRMKHMWEGGVEEIEEHGIPVMFCSFPSVKDPTWEPRGYSNKTTCELLTMIPLDWFYWLTEHTNDQHDNSDAHSKPNKRSQEYNELKTLIANKMWSQFVFHFPQLADKVEYFSVGTGLTNQYYFNCQYGEMYGLEHSLERFQNVNNVAQLRPKTGLPGLYLTGQDVYACGVCGALIGAILCASTVLKLNVYGALKCKIKSRTGSKPKLA